MQDTKQKPRAVFADTDYPLIRRAILFYSTYANEVTEEDKKNISRLYHRLGRVDN